MTSLDKKRDDESLTEAYEITEVSLSGFYEEKGNMLSSLLEGKKILEAGCGTGSLFKYLIDKKFDLTGVDYSKTLLDKAREKNLPVKLFSADLRKKETWKQFESSFDSAISSEVIENSPDYFQKVYSVNLLTKVVYRCKEEARDLIAKTK